MKSFDNELDSVQNNIQMNSFIQQISNKLQMDSLNRNYYFSVCMNDNIIKSFRKQRMSLDIQNSQKQKIKILENTQKNEHQELFGTSDQNSQIEDFNSDTILTEQPTEVCEYISNINELTVMKKRKKIYEEQQEIVYQKKGKQIQKQKNIRCKIFQQRELEQITLELNTKNYFIDQYLDSGGYSDVFSVFQIEEDGKQEEWAIKITKHTNEQGIEEMRSEYNLIKKIKRSFNLINFKEMFIVQINNCYISQLICEKCKYSLFDELKLIQQKNLDFSSDQLFSIIFDLLDGLVEIRVHNIVHQDIKPGNILKNKNDEYVFSDFGISGKLVNDQVRVRGHSFQYCPPEQRTQDYLANYSGDVYSLGKTLLYTIKVYEQVNFVKLDHLTNFIDENMIKDDPSQRMSCLDLLKNIFYLNNKYFSKEFLSKYQQKIKAILHQEIFDKSKDIPFLFQTVIAYKNQLLQIFLTQSLINYSLQDIQNGNLKGFSDIIFNKNEKQTYESISNASEYIQIVDQIGFTYYDLGYNSTALKYFIEVLEVRKICFKENQAEIATSLNEVGRCFSYLGDNQKALQYQLDSLQIFQQLYQEIHPNIVQSLINVGNCYQNIGKYNMALNFQLQSLDILHQLFKQNDPQIAQSLNNLGSSYLEIGDLEKAHKYLYDSLQMFISNYKDNHPDIASSLNNIGKITSDLGDYSSSLKYQLLSLEMRKMLFKDNHPHIGASLNNVGNCYSDLGDNQIALKYQLDSLKMFQTLTKDNHSDTAAALNNIGNRYISSGNYQTALKYHQESLDMRKAVFIQNHPLIAQSLNNVGLCYLYLGDYQNALNKLKESQDMFLILFGNQHPDIASVLNNLGCVYSALRDNATALKFYLESFEMRKVIYKENHPLVAQSVNNIGNCYSDLGDHKNALKYQLKSLSILRRHFQQVQGNITPCCNKGNRYFDQRFHKIQHIFDLELQKIKESNFKEAHSRIASTLDNIGSSYFEIGDKQKALQYELQSLEMKDITKDQSALYLNKVGICYSCLGEIKNALQYYLESLEIFRSFFQDNHNDISLVLNNVGVCYQELGDVSNAVKYFSESCLEKSFLENKITITSN